MCQKKTAIIDSNNGLSHGRRQAIILRNVGILLIAPFTTNFSEILIDILIFSFNIMPLKVLSAKERSFCLGLGVLNFIVVDDGVMQNKRKMIYWVNIVATLQIQP